jgi:phage terminase large subunit-like protein
MWLSPRGSTFDNEANLAAPALAALRARYEGTRLGRQELNAELLEDTAGALWKREWLDAGRLHQMPNLKRISGS